MKRTMTSRIRIAAGVLLAAGLVLGGCTAQEPQAPSASEESAVDSFLVEHGLDGLDTAEVIETLDTMQVSDRPTDLIALVQPSALVLTDGQERETRLPMPADEVYIAVAPYREYTHECSVHSLTTCQGELANAQVQVTLTTDGGETIIDEQRTTFDNGFVGLWVPREITGTLTIEQAGEAGTVAISTMNDDDPTCITSLQLT